MLQAFHLGDGLFGHCRQCGNSSTLNPYSWSPSPPYSSAPPTPPSPAPPAIENAPPPSGNVAAGPVSGAAQAFLKLYIHHRQMYASNSTTSSGRHATPYSTRLSMYCHSCICIQWDYGTPCLGSCQCMLAVAPDFHHLGCAAEDCLALTSLGPGAYAEYPSAPAQQPITTSICPGLYSRMVCCISVNADMQVQVKS